VKSSEGSFNGIKEGQFVRVLGKTWGDAEDIELKSDIIQDFTGVDSELYKKLVL